MGFDIPACDTDDVDADERESEERAVLYLVGERVSEETKKRERAGEGGNGRGVLRRRGNMSPSLSGRTGMPHGHHVRSPLSPSAASER